MKKKVYKQGYILVGICIVLCFLFLSTKPVKVYRLQEINMQQPIVASKAPTDAFKQDVSWQWDKFFQHTGLFALIGFAIGALAGITDRTVGMLTRVSTGALAGLSAGICLGGFIYIWEFRFGYEMLNNMYMLPEKAIDFNKE